MFGFLRGIGTYVKNSVYFVVAFILGGIIIGVGVWIYSGLGATATFEQKSTVVNGVFVALGVLSIILLLAQLRQTARWNRVLSYHQFFGELPGEEKSRAVSECLMRLGIDEPVGGKKLTEQEAETIWADVGEVSESGESTPSARRAVREYLNDFEEFCGAVRAGVLNENYVRELEGLRTINAYFAFWHFIKLTKDEARQASEEGLISADTDDDEIGNEPIKLAPYHELRCVAMRWKRVRNREYSKLLKKRKKRAKKKAREAEEHGVGTGV